MVGRQGIAQLLQFERENCQKLVVSARSDKVVNLNAGDSVITRAAASHFCSSVALLISPQLIVRAAQIVQSISLTPTVSVQLL